MPPDQIQGVFPFDNRSAVHIRMGLFQENDASDAQNQPNEQADQATENQQIDASQEAPVNDRFKTTVTKFFEHFENAFLSTQDAAVTAWKQDGRFYLFYCQPVDVNGLITHTGESKAALLPFTSLDDLHAFLETAFGGSNNVSIEFRSLVFDSVPLDILNQQCLRDENENAASLTNAYSSRLTGSICRCSSKDEEHTAKVCVVFTSVDHMLNTFGFIAA